MNTISITIQLSTPNPDDTIIQALTDLRADIIANRPIPAIVILSRSDYRLRMDKIRIKDKVK